MPKAKAKPPKVIIKELEHALQDLQTSKAAREKELLDTITRLTTTIDNLKSVILTQTKERDAVHETIEKELRYDLSTAHHEIQKFKEEIALHKADAAELRTLKGERMNLLRQLSEAIASREEAEKNHALETHDLTGRITSLKARLETVFNDTLRTAVAEEKKRLALTLDAEAAAALREVGQLRVQVAQQGRQIIQLMRIAEEKEREANLARKEQERATEESEEIASKYAQQTQTYTSKFALSEQLVNEAHTEMKKAIVYAQALHERNQSLLRDNAAFRVQLNLPPITYDNDDIPNLSTSTFHLTMKQTIQRSENGLNELRRIHDGSKKGNTVSSSPSASRSSSPLPILPSPSAGFVRPGSAAVKRASPTDTVKETGTLSSYGTPIPSTGTISPSAVLSSSATVRSTIRPSTAKPTIGVDEIYHEIDTMNRKNTKSISNSTNNNALLRPSSAAPLSSSSTLRPSSSSPSSSPSSSLQNRVIPISPIHTRLYTRPASATVFSSSSSPLSIRGTGNAPPPSSIQSVYYNTGNPATSYIPANSPSSSQYKHYANANHPTAPSLMTSPMSLSSSSSSSFTEGNERISSSLSNEQGSPSLLRPSSARR